MPDTAIRVENLSKAYRIGLKEQTPDTLAGAVASWMRSPLRNFNNLRRLNTFQTNGEAEDIIWALKDVSFDVSEGEVLGIIGRNGAGKSTLLKVLSRITDPTSGKATIRGRVSSLLEVGTGFHPELTGRENIYMNGTILGMSKREIDCKFDEIVEFSGVKRFLDTPIKRYSSGMKVRLAFSVAAHLDPEILIIDEVLAVGDAQFQKRCLGKMQTVARSGRTVLFVSHNLGAVKEMCQTGIVLAGGRIDFWGSVAESICHYGHQMQSSGWQNDRGGLLCWNRIGVSGKSFHDGSSISNHEPFEINSTLQVLEPLVHLRLFCIIESSHGDLVVHHVINERDFASAGLQPGVYRVSAAYPPLWLTPDAYTAHFKAIATTEKGVGVRGLSDRAILDISEQTGRTNGNLRVILTPRVAWEIVECNIARTLDDEPAIETR